MLHSKDHYVAQFNTRFERPIVKGYDGILVGNGCLAAVHWQPRNYKVQLNHADLIGLTQCLSFEMIFQRPITELSGSLLSELHMDQGYYEVQYQKKEAVGKASWCYRGKVGGSPEEQALDYGSFRMESYVHPHQDIYRLNYNGDGPVHQPNAITFELSGILKEQGCTNYDIQEDGLLLNLQINEQTFSLRLQADAGNWEIPNAPITQFSLVGDLQHFSTLSIQTSFNHNPIITNDRDEKEQLRNYWQNFWERSYVDAGHPYLNALYHASLFNIGASSKGQRFVPFNGGLNLWNNNLRYWGDHVWCHNQSQVYLGLNACNHSDLSENFITWILGEQNAARALAKERFSCGGVHYEEVMDYQHDVAKASEFTLPDKDQYCVEYILSSGSRYAILLYEHALYCKNETYLAEQVYPLLCEALQFYIDYAKIDQQGKLQIGPAVAWEEAPAGYNAHTDLAAINALIRALSFCKTQLGSDYNFIDNVEGFINKLPHYPVKDECFSRITQWDGKIASVDHWMWQLPSMSAIFPFKNIHLASSSNDLEIAQNTLQQYLFNADAGHEFLPVIAARLGHPLMWRTTMFNYIQYMQCFNQGLLNYYNIHGNRDQVDGNEKTLHPYLEGSGTLISATTEMLLQSTESRIQVFPAIPEHWHASFELKSMSGITVESQHVAQQGVSFIKLHNPHERDISIDLYIPWKECYIFQSGNCQFLEFKKGFDLHVVIPSETSLSLSESPLKEAPQIQPKLHEKISPCRLGNTWYGLKGVANNHTTGFPLW